MVKYHFKKLAKFREIKIKIREISIRGGMQINYIVEPLPPALSPPPRNLRDERRGNERQSKNEKKYIFVYLFNISKKRAITYSQC